MNDAKNAILEWQDKQISNPQMMRRLIGYDTWNVPISESAAAEMIADVCVSRIQFNQAEDGTKTLLLYTDNQSYLEGFISAGVPIAPQHFVALQ